MSLKVWLPLDGDLHNQGCSDILSTPIGTVAYDNNGKIGLAFISGGASQVTNGISLNTNFIDMFNQNKTCSVAVWVKPLGNHYHYNGTILSSGDWNKKRWAFGVSQDNTKVDVLCHGHNTYLTCSVPVNEWTHLVSVYNNRVCTLYKNGEFIGTYTSSSDFDSDAQNTCIGRETYANGYFGFNGLINDVRIYDHCLSAAEVKKIAQGLVLHYKLDQPIGLTDIIQYPTTYNVYNNYSSSGTTGTLTNLSETYRGSVVRREVMTPNDTSINHFKSVLGSHGVYGHKQTFLANTKYVFWIYYRPISHMDVRVGGTASNISGWTEIPPVSMGNGWYRVGQYRNGTVTSDKRDDIYTSFYASTAVSGSPIIIDWASPHLLQGTTEIPNDDSFMGNDKIIDSSGYGHNGTINGTLTLSDNTARYSICGYFGAYNTPNIIVNDTSSFAPALSNCTMTWWGKYDTTKTLLFTGQTTSYYIAASNDNTFYHSNVGSNTKTFYKDGVAGSYKCAADGWHFFAITGLDLSTWTTLKLNSYNSSWPLKGYINDLRIYSTVLSAADIKQLYEVGAKIDNKQNLHTYEFNENNSNIFSSIPWTSPYSTRSSISSLFSNYNTNGEPQFTVNGTSAGTDYITIVPGTYRYDYTISVNTGNQFYIGFERYDENKTPRSNEACVYTYATKPSSDIIKQRYTGTVDLSTDGTNPIKYITLRILNGWSGTTSGVTGQATIHNFSLRLVSSISSPKLKKTSEFIINELKENTKASFYQDGIVEANNLIEF